jgi:uncharacterized membrane protein YkvA (DUF1232 family)
MFRLLRLWRIGGRDLGLLWSALRHPGRPMWLWPVVLVLGVYALEPFNFAFPILGVVDDLVILPMLLHLLVKFLPTDVSGAAAVRR